MLLVFVFLLSVLPMIIFSVNHTYILTEWDILYVVYAKMSFRLLTIKLFMVFRLKSMKTVLGKCAISKELLLRKFHHILDSRSIFACHYFASLAMSLFQLLASHRQRVPRWVALWFEKWKMPSWLLTELMGIFSSNPLLMYSAIVKDNKNANRW